MSLFSLGYCLAFLDPSEAAALRPGRRIDLGNGAGPSGRLCHDIRVGACDHDRRSSGAAQCDAAHRCAADVEELVVGVAEERIGEGAPGGGVDRHGPTAGQSRRAKRQQRRRRYGGIDDECAVLERRVENDLLRDLRRAWNGAGRLEAGVCDDIPGDT